jgi:hypothetical protein
MAKPNSRFNTQIILIFVFLIFAIWIGMDSLSQPDLVSANAPITDFSAARAMEQLKIITQKPHPVGSQAIREVRDYIFDQLKTIGLSPEIQKASVFKTLKGRVIGATVNNVIAKIPGTSSTKAIALDAHYDSMPTTPGASDCGSCIVTLLETARALKAGPPLKNDIIFVFTDIEEFGPALGAQAFFKEHRWAKDISIVLNFEGIGRTGPSVMYETGPSSNWLVKAFGQTVTHPVAQSWLFDVYKKTPINTDFNVYTKEGIAGLNFAYLNEGTVYHTELDNYNTIDRRSVQHHGSNALSMLRYLGNLDLNKNQNDNNSDSIYFTLIRGWLINYPVTWAIPITITIGVLLIVTIFIGLYRKQVSVLGISFGFLSFLLSLILTAGLTFGIWQLIYATHSQYQVMYFGRIYDAYMYLFAFIALALAINTSFFLLFKKKINTANLTLGIMIWWWLLSIATSLMMPGFSYLFTWPLLFISIGLGIIFWKNQSKDSTWFNILITNLSIIPAVIIYTPAMYLMYQFAPTSLLVIPVVMVALLIGLLTPLIDVLISARGWWIPGLSFLLAAGLLIAGTLTADFSKENPRPNSIAYMQNVKTGKSIWFSRATKPDDWTTQFFQKDKKITSTKFGALIPLSLFANKSVITVEAPTISIAPPSIEVLDDQIHGDIRKVKLLLKSNRAANLVTIDMKPSEAIQSITIDQQRISKPRTSSDYLGLIYYAIPPEGIIVNLDLDPTKKINALLTDQSWDLPVIPGLKIRPRSEDMIPMPNFDYGTVLVRSFQLNQK